MATRSKQKTRSDLADVYSQFQVLIFIFLAMNLELHLFYNQRNFFIIHETAISSPKAAPLLSS